MTQKIIKIQKIKEWGRARALLIKYSTEESGNTLAKRERFLAILNNQYGQALEKAVDELEHKNPSPTIAC